MSKIPNTPSSRKILGSVSSAALAVMLATAGSAQAQTNTSMVDGQTITLAAPVSVSDSPVVVVANNDVTVENNTSISTTGITQTIQVDATTTGAVINNSTGSTISADSRAINVDGDNATINNSGSILGTGDQRNGTIYGNRTSDNLIINNTATGVIDAGVGNSGAAIAIEVGGGGAPITGAVTNAGLIQGRGQASAAGGTAGDGLRFFGPGLAPVYQYNGDITNSGTITSESAVGTTAGVRFANRINFGGTLENTAEGTISGVNNGLYFGEADHTGGTVINDGTISSESRALNIDGSGLTVLNRGEIIGTGNPRNGTVYLDSTAQNFVLNNEGIIDAGAGLEGAGFSAELSADGNDFTIINSTAAVIQGRGQAAAGLAGAGDGLRFERTRVDGALEGSTTGLFTGDITNAGLINSESAQGTAAAIRFVNGTSFSGVIENEETGVISGVQNGLYFGNATPAGGGDFTGAVVNNAGVISSDSRAVNIDGTGLVLNNTGSILGTGNQRNGTVYSDGTAQNFTVNNAGTIDAGEGFDGSGFAAEIVGENTFVLDNSGTIEGRGQGAFSDGLRIGNGGNTGIANASITNSGTINSESLGAGAVSGVRIVNGVALNGTLSNTETGVISGAQNGLYFGTGDHSNAVVENAGLISSDSRALNIDGSGLAVNNTGSILGTGNQRNGTVYADSTAQSFTLNNAGTIDAGAGNEGAGFSAELSETGNEFSISNSALIQGRGQAGAGLATAGDGLRFERTRVDGALDGTTTGLFTGDITNSGTIDSEAIAGTTAGIRFVNGTSFQGTLNNEVGGVISGVNNGLYFGNATPAGGADHTGGVVNNAGVISSDSRALNIDGAGLVVNNSGSILGTGDQRNGTVYADATADLYTLNNLSGGVIDAGAGNNGSGVSLQSGNVDGETVSFSLVNEGTIAGRGTELVPAGVRIFGGADNVTVDGDITNSGLISSEDAAAILIENVNFAGTITNSGTLSGTSVLDASTATGAVSFNQIGGAFNADFIGSDFDDNLSVTGTNFALNADVIGGVETTIDAVSTTVSGSRSLEGNLTSNGNLTFDLGVDSLAVDGNTTFGADSTVTVTTNTNVSEIILDTPITVISETGTFTDNGLDVNVIDDDFLVDYDVALGSVTVTATAAALDDVSDDANISAVSSVISTAFAAGQLDSTIANTLNDVSNAGEFGAEVVSLLPTVNESVSREIWETHKQTADYISSRLSSDAPNGAWVQGEFRSSDRDSESVSVDGYEADTSSVTFGYDRKVSDALRLGASYTRADIDIDEDGNEDESNDLNTNQLSVYAGYDAGNVFISGQAGYVFGSGDSERVTETGATAADFDVDGFVGQVTASYELGVFTPQAGLRYGNVSQESFTETGGLNLTVDVDDVQYLEAVVGGKFTPEVAVFGDWTVKPTLGVNYVYDFIGDARDVNVTLPGASAVRLSSGDPAESRFEVTAGIDLVSVSGVSVGVSYEGDFSSGYSSNAGLIRARLGF